MTADADPLGDVAPGDRRAVWVGLRTLRQRPRYVGQSAAGEPVFEVRSVRLVLRPDAPQFNRLLQCAKCGTDVVGRRVFAPADLDRPENSVICTECVRKGTPPAAPAQPWVEQRPGVARPPAVKRAPTPAVAAGPVAAPAAADDARLAALEARIEDLGAGLAAVAATAEAQAKATAAEGDAGVAGVAELVQVQGETLATISRALAEVRTGVEEWTRGVAEAHSRLEARLSELTGRVESREAAVDERIEALAATAEAETSRLHVLEERIQASLRRMTRLVGAEGSHRPPPAAAEPPPAARGPAPTAMIDDLERQLQEAEGRLARRSSGRGETA